MRQLHRGKYWIGAVIGYFMFAVSVRADDISPGSNADVSASLGLVSGGSDRAAPTPEELSICADRGFEHERLQQWQNAIEDYNECISGWSRLIAQYPKYSDLWVGAYSKLLDGYERRARVYEQTEESEKAINDYLQVINCEKEVASHGASSASNVGADERFKMSLNAFDRRGWLYEKLGQFQKAVAEYSQMRIRLKQAWL